jgi:hypothetical protein
VSHDPTSPDVRVHYEPDYEAVTFDHEGTPLLTFDPALNGSGWRLYYLDSSGGVEDHWIPGDVTELEAVVASARHWLAQWRWQKCSGRWCVAADSLEE